MELTSLELTKRIVKVLDSKKAQDIEAIHVHDLTIIADYFVLCSATSNTQLRALADEVEHVLKEEGTELLRTEGYRSGSWVLLDYGSVIVHIFYKETREFYKLERIWADGTRVDLSEILTI